MYHYEHCNDLLPYCLPPTITFSAPVRNPASAVLPAGSTISEKHRENDRRCIDCIQLFIFSGGMLPTRCEIRSRTACAGLIPRLLDALGLVLGRRALGALYCVYENRASLR
jgi:hypothetical protein